VFASGLILALTSLHHIQEESHILESRNNEGENGKEAEPGLAGSSVESALSTE
jgi:hypothetical protein